MFVALNIIKMDKSLDIEITEEIAEGVYSNFAVISHSPTEFVFDFVRILPGTEKAAVKSRVITSPEQAKRLLLSLQENIKTYEAMFGSIALHNTAPNEQMVHLTPMGEA